MARILLLDEDSPLRILTRQALRLAGHETVLVSTAAETIARATTERFDVMLVDLTPPDMDGIAMLQRLALVTGHGGTPILTMSDHEVDLLSAARAGAMDHLRKPFGFKELESSLNRVLRPAPAEVEDLRVIKQTSAELYSESLSLVEEVRSAG
jgi:DNA-binding response OmpR family regulator